MFESVLVANRGEIAIRIIRACHELGVRAIAVHSAADADALHVRMADEAHVLPGAIESDGYLDIAAIVDVAINAGAEAVHPGYGFLAENAAFAQAVADAGLTFVGPSPEAIAAMGDKLSARAVAIAAGVPVVPGTTDAVTDVDVALTFGAEHGYPVAVKAMFGGGGRGMKVVREPGEMAQALAAAEREALASFGRGECYLERYLERPRHIEVQILADETRTLHLGDRDCSLQRRHQKLIEEAPAPGLDPEVRQQIAEAAIAVARQMGYRNAGTCEFLLDEGGRSFHFLEMNTRLQVEHPVTELVTGIDLVHEQLRIASGDGLTIEQEDVRIDGSAIEARINAEDPAAGFLPAPGTISALTVPDGPWVRFDTGVESGSEILPYYDSLVGKLVVWARDRDTARARLSRALAELTVDGIATTTPFHLLAVSHPQFADAQHSTKSVEAEWDLSQLPESTATPKDIAMPHPRATDPVVTRDVELTLAGESAFVTVYGQPRHDYSAGELPRRTRDRAAGAAADSQGGDALCAPMQGTIVTYLVEDGAIVKSGEVVCVLEAMKMENHLTAHRDGTVRLTHGVGDAVDRGTVLATIED